MVREHEDIILTATLATPSVATVTWFKDGVEIRRSKRHEMASLGDTHTLTMRGAQTLDSAVYSCRVGTEGQDFPVQVEGEQLHGVVLWEPLVGSILEWRLGAAPGVQPGGSELVPRPEPCQADVPSPPLEVAAKFCRPLEPVSGDLGGTVMLVCELSPAQAEVVWRRGSTQLRAGKRFQMAAAGPRRSLTVSGLRAEDAGEYVCESRDDHTSAMLTVIGMRVPGLRAESPGRVGSSAEHSWEASWKRCPSAESARGGGPAYPVCISSGAPVHSTPCGQVHVWAECGGCGGGERGHFPVRGDPQRRGGHMVPRRCPTTVQREVSHLAEGCQPQPDHLKPGPGGCRPGHCAG